MKNLEKILYVLAIIFLLIVILVAPLRILVFNEDFYYSQFEKNGVYRNINESDAKLILDNLLLFFQDEQTLSFFEDDEKSHLDDVKVLVNRFFYEMYASIILFLGCLAGLFFLNKKEFRERFFKILFLGGLCSFVAVALFFLASLNFAITFQGFHELFFPQGNYLFPGSSLLITLFPEAFFRSFFLRMMLISLILSVIAMIPQFVLNKMKD